jgi:signal transduction histidine kinase
MPHSPKKLDLRYLPAYADFLIKNKLEDCSRTQLQFSREEKIPLLKYFENLPDDDLIEMGKQGYLEMLTALAQNKTDEYIKASVSRFVKNNIPSIEREIVVAEDITILSLIRKRVLRKFIEDFTKDIPLIAIMMEEFDRFLAASEAASFNAYLEVQQEKIRGINMALAERQQDLLEAEQLADMGSFFWDLKFGKSIFTPGVMRIFEMEESSNLDSFMQDVHPEDRMLLKKALERALSMDGIYECEYRFIKNNKEKRIWSRGRVNFNGKEPLSMKGTIMEVTDKHKMLNQLRRSEEELQVKTIQLERLNASLELKNAELERINKELASFNYVVSHDLKEPLRKIQIFTNRILEKGQRTIAADTTDYFNKIIGASSRMQLLIEDLLMFSQTTADENNFEQVDMNVVLEEVKNILSVSVEDAKATINSLRLPVLKAIPFQMQQLLSNVISNSIKYAKEDSAPYIRISSSLVKKEIVEGGFAIGEYWKISVEDNGIGFESQNAEKIFGLFQRLHNKDKYSGTGIGLAICKKIVHNHNGWIEASSDGHSGSVFNIYLPASA